MKLYDKVKTILEFYPETRSSDKKLIWQVWTDRGRIINGSITYNDFMNANTPESITRARRKVQELHPHLQAKEEVQEERNKIQQEKGNHVFTAKLL